MRSVTFVVAVGLLLMTTEVLRSAFDTHPSEQRTVVGAIQDPNASAAVAPSPVASASPIKLLTGTCSRIRVDLDRANPSIRGASAASEAAITASVVEIGPARWGTPDGTQPVVTDRIPSPLSVYRLARVKVLGVGHGPLAAGDLVTVRVPGGSIGCSTFEVGGYPDFAPGEPVALFLGALPSLSRAPGAGFDVVDALPIVDGRVRTLDGTDVSVENFLAISAQN